MAKELNINLIPKEKFEFANTGDKIRDQKFEDKPIGYFRDAWNRFCKNKASIVAALIIIGIVLFAVIVPFFNASGSGTHADTRYMKKIPRNLFLSNFGIATGNTTDEYRDTALIQYAAIGIGANTDFDNIPTIGEAIEKGDDLQPVKKIKDTYTVQQGKNNTLFYKAVVDTYLQVGYTYEYVEQEEYANIVKWQEETGIQVLYPLIDENEHNFYYATSGVSDPNWWYKTNTKGQPVRINQSGNTTTIKYEDITEITLVENYKRDTNGDLCYWEFSGGGDENTAMYKIRVLYYNYYRYNHDGREPQFLFGTDSVGYDLAYRMAVGIRLSLILAVCIFAINFLIGAIYGAIEGYYGGTTDLVMEFISYVLSGIPFMVVATLFQMHLAADLGAVPSLLFAFIITGWIGTASRVRTQFYRFKNQEYVMAARTLGARDKRIIWKHIFPNTLGTIITSSVLSIPGVIFSESMLSYLGIINLGGTKTTSLGTLLSDASTIWKSVPHLMLFPATVISLLMICFNLFGNGLRDAFNPSLRGVEE